VKEAHLKIDTKSLTTEEKADFVKRNKGRLVLPVYGELTDEFIDRMVYNIKNNWNMGGSEACWQLDNMYNALKK
jgi:hypothetical protein